MNLQFLTRQQLFERVKPALNTRKQEITRDGYPYILIEDIWKYLIENKWVNAHDLNLCDIVDDILSVSEKEVDEYLKKQLIHNRTQYFDNKIDVI